MTSASFGARNAYGDALRRLYKITNSRPEVTFICGAGIRIKTTLLFVQTLMRDRFVFVRTVDEAFARLRMLAQGDESAARADEGAQSVSVRSEEIDVLVELIGRPVWFRETSDVPIPLDSPLRVLEEAIWRVNADMKELIESESAKDRELSDYQERLELAVEAGGLGFWDWDLTTGTFYFNPRCSTMLGYAPGELPMGLATLRPIIHPEDRRNVNPPDSPRREGRESVPD